MIARRLVDTRADYLAPPDPLVMHLHSGETISLEVDQFAVEMHIAVEEPGHLILNGDDLFKLCAMCYAGAAQLAASQQAER